MSSKADKQIAKCITEITAIQLIFENPSEVLMEIANQGKEIAKEQLGVYGISANGDLGQSIDARLVNKNTSELSADGGHAVYVEYGAGIVGKNKPHPSAKAHGVEYNKGEQIVHFDDEQKDYWTYMDEKTGKFFRTHGQQSKPFMHKTIIKLNRKAPSIVRNKIKELMK